MIQLAKTGYYVRDILRGRVYCPAGETLRKKSIKKDGGIRYSNKTTCRKCSYRLAGFCTKSDFKVVEFADKKYIAKCTNWAVVEYEDTSKEEDNEPTASKKDEEQVNAEKASNEQSSLMNHEADDSSDISTPKADSVKEEEKQKNDTGPMLVRMKRKLVATKEVVIMRLTPDREKTKFRMSTAEHPFGTMKETMQRDAFSTRRLSEVTGEFALTGFGYNFIHGCNYFGFQKMMEIMMKEKDRH